jgi:ketosteroid isomerase-like protein
MTAASASVKTEQSAEERLAYLELERDAREFLAKYSYYFDGKNLEGLMTLYTPDCVLVNTAGTYAGIEAIRRMQEGDMPKTTVSFHHFNNIIVVVDDINTRTAYVTAYMYNLAIRDDEPYGTVGTVVFCLKDGGDGTLKASAVRIAIDSRHSFTPKFVPPGEAGPNAASVETSYDLVGQRPRFPVKV